MSTKNISVILNLNDMYLQPLFQLMMLGGNQFFTQWEYSSISKVGTHLGNGWAGEGRIHVHRLESLFEV